MTLFKNSLDRKSILIIDDNIELADSLCEYLGNHGYFTLAAYNVNDAIKKLENQKFHLIVVDLHLGDQNGEKIINVIRKDLCGLNMRSPILVCSGHLDSKSLVSLRHYVDDAIIKPFKPHDLLAKANHWTNLLSTKDPTQTQIVSEVKLQVLVIDDNAELADNICNFLNSDDTYNALACYNILDTKLKLGKQKFDCILMDRHLRQRESTELIKLLRSDMSLPNHKTPIVVITGDLTDSFVTLLRDDVQGFIRKPLALRELNNVINFVVSSS